MLDVPAGVTLVLPLGANPFQPAEIVRELRDHALELQQREADARQPQ